VLTHCEEIVTYSTPALVRTRKRAGPLWLPWNDRVGRRALLIVRTASVEIVGRSERTLGLGSYVFPGEAARMRRDRSRLIGLPIAKRDWLRIEVNDGLKFAVSPKGDIDAAWPALTVAGARTA
jgi:hypothetical protein